MRISCGLLSFLAVIGSIAAPAYAERPFCDNAPVCASASGQQVDRLRAAWMSSATTDVQRDKMKSLITAETVADWTEIADGYFSWVGNFKVAPKSFEDYWKSAKEAVRSVLIDPDSAKFEPRSGFVRGTWGKFVGSAVCFTVNAKNRVGGYAGPKMYAAVIDGYGRVLKVDQDFGGFNSNLIMGCVRGLMPPVNFDPDAPAVETQNNQSIASQMQSLAELRQRGLLTDAEFSAAKAKILSGGK